MNSEEISVHIDEMINGPQYETPQVLKEEKLLSVLSPLCEQVAKTCPPYNRFITRLSVNPFKWKRLAEIPPLPVSMFKHFTLSAVPPDKIVRELHSSSTTSQNPSKIFIDKTTAFRQSKALVSILKEHIGKARRPYLVLDTPDSVGTGGNLTARGAAIRGIGSFATKTVFGMRQLSNGDLEPDFEAIEDFFTEIGDCPVIIFGFTFIIWTKFVIEAENLSISFKAPNAILLHSGGWKKLKSQAVSKEIFNNRTSYILGNSPAAILDFYGMVEQVGTVFVDCEVGNKHAPAFADVIIRKPNYLTPVTIGESGIIEVISVLPTSYPGQVIITEDLGVLLGTDDCPCGRKGNYFRFTNRVEKLEIRGCGDTFAQSRKLE